MVYNVWHAAQMPVTTPPGLAEQGRQKLHEQLEQSKQNESQLEKQAWNSIPELRQLIDWHQHRIEQLTGNTEAGEIVAYDRDAIARMEKRIAELIQQEQEREQKLAEQAAQKSEDKSTQQQPAVPTRPNP
jgi:CRISPR/Cas system CMR-associated protein Cmr1 (group 7 of RAMP superfamily)